MILKDGCQELGFHIDDNQVQQLLTYKDILLEWNEKMNLTAITEEEEVMVKHFLDSLSCIQSQYLKEEGTMIDVGTGAGFPGIPLKVYFPKLKLTLLDSLNKRVEFLKEVSQELGLEDVNFVHGRAEECGQEETHREQYDYAVARAVASLNVLVEYCLPFVKVGGYFICQKGPQLKEEIQNSQNAITVLGGKVVEQKEITLPFSDITHSLLVIEKIKQTPTKYPRKPGTPSKKPIK